MKMLFISARIFFAHVKEMATSEAERKAGEKEPFECVFHLHDYNSASLSDSSSLPSVCGLIVVASDAS